MVLGAVLAALAGAFCFGVAAALQQQEAIRVEVSGVADPRLLWRLAHRPVWLAGILADGLSAGLHILALSLGSISLVQPLGVTGLLFAIPVVASRGRHRVRGRDVVAAVVVLIGLAVLLRMFSATTASGMGDRSAIIVLVVTAVMLAAGAATLGQVAPGRPRALLLAAGAGMSFGITAVLVRALLLMAGQPHPVGATLAAAFGIATLVPIGYLLLQNAYRAGYFAASLATAVVTDPLAAIFGGAFVLHEPLPSAPGQVLTAIVSALVVCAGITALVRSPGHVFTIAQ